MNRHEIKVQGSSDLAEAGMFAEVIRKEGGLTLPGLRGGAARPVQQGDIGESGRVEP